MRKQAQVWSILLLAVVSGLAYLPLVGKFGYLNDDWYLMYSASAYGPQTFIDIFSVDRPGRALVMIPAYALFGGDPLPYNLSAWFFRLTGGLALLWILNRIWPGKRTVTTLMALLFVIYPGFLSQPNAIDYQSHILGLAAALLSIALTLKATLSESRLLKITFHGLAILLGWFYLSQMEWYLGFEFFRWACVFVLASRLTDTLLHKAGKAFRWASPALAIPIFFLIWRLFFFESERGATDTEVQFEALRLYPIQTFYHWTVQVVQDLFDVLVSAWAVPLSELMRYVQGWGAVLAVGAAALVLFVLNKVRDQEDRDGSPTGLFSQEAIWLGFVSAAAGLLPVAMANREVAFPFFSRYSLVSSVGVSIFVVALLANLKAPALRAALAAALVLISVLTHHANSVRVARETEVVRTFWWQVSWRVPQFAPRATLIGNYPAAPTEEDYFIWGPANLIYYPEKQNTEKIQPALFASVLNKGMVLKVLTKERQKQDVRKNIVTYPNHRNIVVLTQPTANSCVHVLNGLQPEFSQGELDAIRVIGPYSELEHVLADEAPHTPPIGVFGPEPRRGWCYYYEKADLARQRGDWEAVLRLDREASAQGFVPADTIEWMPFLQAYARTADVERLRDLAPGIASDPYAAAQACRILSSLPELSGDVIEVVDSLYCLE